MLAVSSGLALSWTSGMAAPHLTPAMPALSRSVRPAMLDLGSTTQWIADAASGLDPVLLPDTGAAASAAVEAVAEDPSWFDIVLVKPFELSIVTLHTTLQGVGIEQAYGPSIILFTLILKLLTFPLNKQQIESTSKMQAIQPAAKALQEKYRNKDPARLNLELQQLYQDNQVNPLAGCLPSLAQIPIFIGLYRSVLNLAKADKLDEGFLWLPSLEGPVSDYTKGSGWLFGDAAQGYAWTDFTPPLGWADTGAYLALPVLLVCSQYVSSSILTPKSDDPAQQQTQAILKFLPLMIGWFSLSVPSGLGLYWITNNVVTTATTLLIRNSVPTPSVAGMDGGVSSAEPVKSQGFGRKYGEVVTKQSEDGTTVKISPPGTRKERRAAVADGPVVDAVVVDAAMGAAATGGPAAAAQVVDAQITELDTGGGVGGDAEGKKKKKKKSKKAKK